jgi:heparan-sulfate lyase
MRLFKKLIILTAISALAFTAFAQEKMLSKESFAIINLDQPGLEKVKKAVSATKYEVAADALLKYYRERSSVRHLNFNTDDIIKFKGKKVNAETKQLADNILLHKFKPHKGYPTYDYGKDINWQYRPVKDQLLSTFLHRTAFWESLGLVYRSTGDETYAKEWIFQVKDWIRKNKQGAYSDDKDYGWKAFVVSFRLNHWSGLFNLFLQSPNFTPSFLMEFLNSYHEQANYVMANYTDIGNHRLYEALHLMYAGSNFPELKDAAPWRKSGIEVLNTEIGKQVLPDGIQFELSPGYHIGTIKIFLDALRITQLAGMEKEFPKTYIDHVEKMVLGVGKYSFPDYQYPLFGNSFATNKGQMLKNYKEWAAVFPGNKIIEYYATDGARGQKPDYLSSALPNAGFYALRNGWDANSTVMQIKAGPIAGFHSQPDNGNFVLWIKGRNFTPDAGSFVYANVGGHENSKRDWYRSTKAHQTLTLNDKNIENNARLMKWETSDNLDILSYINPSYTDLQHQRTFLFIDKSYFIIIDRAIGQGIGKLDIRFNLKEDNKPVFDHANKRVYTTYTDNNNLLIQSFNKSAELKEEESFVSYEYQKETPRPAFAFEQQKPDRNTKSFITIIYPFGKQTPRIELKENSGNDLDKGLLDISLTIDGSKKILKKDLTK